jgi:hypothetical protein
MKQLMRGLVALVALATASSPCAAQDVWPPSTVASFTFYPGFHTIVLNWNSPGDDCDTGTADAYELRYSTSTITAGNFAGATPIGTGTPQGAGSIECANLSSLTPSTLYYFAIRTRDEAYNWSPLTFGSQSTNSGGTEESCP